MTTMIMAIRRSTSTIEPVPAAGSGQTRQSKLRPVKSAKPSIFGALYLPTASSSCLFDIFERPLIPRRLASS